MSSIDTFEKTQRREWSWTPMRRRQADDVINVVNELRDYWPLTLRQVHYRLVAAGLRENTKSKYNDLSSLLKWMRHDEMLDWDAVEDRTRRVSDKRGWTNAADYSAAVLNYFLAYERCYIQGQESHVELWCEKDALSSVFQRIADRYCLRLLTGRGYISQTALKQYADRAGEAIIKGQKPIVLYFGDFDPSGVQMFEASIQTIEDEHGVRGIDFRRIGLNPDQVNEYDIPPSPDALKESDPRAARFIERFGRVSVELDALHPEQLEDLASDAVEDCLDMDLVNEQRRAERVERRQLADLRSELVGLVQQRLGGAL